MIFKYGGVVNLKDPSVKLIVKSTDLDYLYGQDERSHVCYKYDIQNALLEEALPEEFAYCRNGYRLNGQRITIGGEKVVLEKYALAGDDPIWFEGMDGIDDYQILNSTTRRALGLLVNPNVDGDRIYQILKLKDYEPVKFKIKRNDDRSLVVKMDCHNDNRSTEDCPFDEISVKSFLMILQNH